mgnify:CR=1 FL=1
MQQIQARQRAPSASPAAAAQKKAPQKKAARALAARGADVRRTNAYGATSVAVAAALGHADVLQVLLRVDPRGAQTVDQNGAAPLHVAAARGRGRPDRRAGAGGRKPRRADSIQRKRALARGRTLTPPSLHLPSGTW